MKIKGLQGLHGSFEFRNWGKAATNIYGIPHFVSFAVAKETTFRMAGKLMLPATRDVHSDVIEK